MKLITTIKPRREGVVNVFGVDRLNYRFEADENGDLVCDIEEPAVIAQLLALSDFMPLNEGDFTEAKKLLESTLEGAGGGADGGADGGIDDGTQSGGQEDLDDDEGDENAMPVEGVSASAPIERIADKEPETILLGTDSFPAVIELTADKTITLGELVAAAHAASGLSVAEWNALSEADRAGALAAHMDVLWTQANPEPEEKPAEPTEQAAAAPAPAPAPAKTGKKR